MSQGHDYPHANRALEWLFCSCLVEKHPSIQLSGLAMGSYALDWTGASPKYNLIMIAVTHLPLLQTSKSSDRIEWLQIFWEN